MTSPPRRSTRSAAPAMSTHSTGSSNSSATGNNSHNSTRSDKNKRSQKDEQSPLVSDFVQQLLQTGEIQQMVPTGAEDESSGDVTRCVCGFTEYSGPAAIDDYRDLAEEAGSFFIQCDDCKVWQHGGCLGMMNGEKTPDDYICEKCNPSLHIVHQDLKGQSYSVYLPTHPEGIESLRQFLIIGHDSPERLRAPRTSITKELGPVDLLGPRKRSTMNSRQNYDEDEMLRRAIEASKGEQETNGRKGKRGRDDSDDSKLDVKRQRTGSESIGTGSHSREIDSDGEGKSIRSMTKRIRSTAAEDQRQKELREREQTRHQERGAAADRRKERAGRRRAEDGEMEENIEVQVEENDQDSHIRAASPPAIEVNPPSSSHKKSTSKKPKRSGRNQYSKDREKSPPGSKAASSSPHEEPLAITHRNLETIQQATINSPALSSASNTDGIRTAKVSHKARGKISRSRSNIVGAALTQNGQMMSAPPSPTKNRPVMDNLSIEEMQQRTQDMLDFITRHQNYVRERASTSTGNSSSSSTSNSLSGLGIGNGNGNGILIQTSTPSPPRVSSATQVQLQNGKKGTSSGLINMHFPVPCSSSTVSSVNQTKDDDVDGDGSKKVIFQNLSTVDKMDILLRNIVQFKEKYNHGGIEGDVVGSTSRDEKNNSIEGQEGITV